MIVSFNYHRYSSSYILQCYRDDTFLSLSVKVHYSQRVGYLSTSFSFHICPQCASEFLPCICVSSYFWLPVSLCISARFVCVCVVVNALSVRSRATFLAGAVCTNIGCGGGLRGSQGKWEGMGQPWYVHAHAHTHGQTHTHARARTHTATEAGSSKSYTPLRDARTHTGTDTQEEGAASAALIKTVAAYLSLPLTRGTVKEKKKQEISCVTNKHALLLGVRGGGSTCVWGVGHRQRGCGLHSVLGPECKPQPSFYHFGQTAARTHTFKHRHTHTYTLTTPSGPS